VPGSTGDRESREGRRGSAAARGREKGGSSSSKEPGSSSSPRTARKAVDGQRGDDTQRSCRIRERGVPRDAPAVPSRVAGSRARAPRPDAAGDTAAATALDASGITTYPDPTDHERVWVRDVKFWVLRANEGHFIDTFDDAVTRGSVARRTNDFAKKIALYFVFFFSKTRARRTTRAVRSSRAAATLYRYAHTAPPRTARRRAFFRSFRSFT
jgi:hypothetical protein